MHRTCATVLGTAALALAGCGGGEDDSSSSSSGPPLTKAQFIVKANAICKDTIKAQKPFSDQLDKLQSSDLKAAAPIIEGALKVSQTGFDRLKALSRPAEDKATLDTYYAAAEKVLDAAGGLSAAATSGDRAQGNKVAKSLDALGNDEERAAKTYGIRECETAF